MNKRIDEMDEEAEREGKALRSLHSMTIDKPKSNSMKVFTQRLSQVPKLVRAKTKARSKNSRPVRFSDLPENLRSDEKAKKLWKLLKS